MSDFDSKFQIRKIKFWVFLLRETTNFASFRLFRKQDFELNILKNQTMKWWFIRFQKFILEVNWVQKLELNFEFRFWILELSGFEFEFEFNFLKFKLQVQKYEFKLKNAPKSPQICSNKFWTRFEEIWFNAEILSSSTRCYFHSVFFHTHDHLHPEKTSSAR